MNLILWLFTKNVQELLKKKNVFIVYSLYFYCFFFIISGATLFSDVLIHFSCSLLYTGCMSEKFILIDSGLLNNIYFKSSPWKLIHLNEPIEENILI